MLTEILFGNPIQESDLLKFFAIYVFVWGFFSGILGSLEFRVASDWTSM